MRASGAKLEVPDVCGARVRTLAEGKQQAGEQVETWNGLDSLDRAVKLGVHFVRLSSGVERRARRVPLIQ